MKSTIDATTRETEYLADLVTAFPTIIEKFENEEEECGIIPQEKLDHLQSEYETLTKRLNDAKSKKLEIQKRRALLHTQQYEVQQVRDAVITRINALSSEQYLLKEHLDSMTEETAKVASQLKRYMQIDAINDAFYIWYSGSFGTINNFRLGNLPTITVEWSEINAAFGQAMMAIETVAYRAHYAFQRYKLLPMGSFSKLYKIDDKRNILNLYSDGTFQLFPKRSFNAALVGFLSCVQELGDYITLQDPTMQLPYIINYNDGKINELLVLLGTDDEIWTRALKYLLTDIKFIVTWASKKFSQACKTAVTNGTTIS